MAVTDSRLTAANLLEYVIFNRMFPVEPIVTISTLVRPVAELCPVCDGTGVAQVVARHIRCPECRGMCLATPHKCQLVRFTLSSLLKSMEAA